MGEAWHLNTVLIFVLLQVKLDIFPYVQGPFYTSLNSLYVFSAGFEACLVLLIANPLSPVCICPVSLYLSLYFPPSIFSFAFEACVCLVQGQGWASALRANWKIF